MKKLIILLTLSISTFVLAQEKNTIKVGDFSILKVYNGLNVELISSDTNALEIIGNTKNKVKHKIVSGMLKIYLPFPQTTTKDDTTIKLYYSSIITTIDANEGATILAAKFTQQNVEVKVQEGAYINMNVACKYLTIKAIQGGIIKLKGTAKNQVVNTNTGGIYHGYNLKASANTTVSSGTGSKSELYASEAMDLKVSFGGTIFYKGKPENLKTKKVLGGIIQAKN